MTLVFALGLATVLIPIGLGLAGLGQFASQFHTEIFIAGGLFMLLLGIFTLLGKSLVMPFKTDSPNLKKIDALSIYQLGLFSGFASSCCLPVLAGVLTLSLISASFIQAFLLGWAYVLGMVVPLVVLALLWEKYNLAEHPIMKGRTFTMHIFGKKIGLHSTSVFSGAILSLIGLLTLVAAFTHNITATSNEQIQLSMWLQGTQNAILRAAQIIPDWFFLAVLVIITLFLAKKAMQEKGVKK